MIIKYKLFEKYVDFHDDFFKKEIKDIDYYLNKIDKLNVNIYYITQLFHWSCMKKLNDFAYKLSKKISREELSKLSRSLSYLNFETFEKIIIENKLLNYFLKDKIFIEIIIASSDIKKFKFLEQNGMKLNQKFLELSCYHNSLDIFKYLITKGLDPNKRTENNFSRIKENCLDICAKYNGDNIFINYLVNELNIPVTYRHMVNVLHKDNYKSFEILIKSKNIIDDYSYSNYSTHDKYPITLFDVINLLISKNKNTERIFDYIKILIKDELKIVYYGLQRLDSKRVYINNGDPFGPHIKILKPQFLEICYYIIDKYNGSENEYTTHFITTHHKDFWMEKMKKNPSIIKKLKGVNFNNDYDYQKLILDLDENNIKIIMNNIHPKIIDEYRHLPEIFDLVTKNYNI